MAINIFAAAARPDLCPRYLTTKGKPLCSRPLREGNCPIHGNPLTKGRS